MKKFVIFYKTVQMGEIVQTFLAGKGYPWTILLNVERSLDGGIGNFDSGGHAAHEIRFTGYKDESIFGRVKYTRFQAETDFGAMIEFFNAPEYKEIELNNEVRARLLNSSVEIWHNNSCLMLIPNRVVLELENILNPFDWKNIVFDCNNQTQKDAAALFLSKMIGCKIDVHCSQYVGYCGENEAITGFPKPSDKQVFRFLDIPIALLQSYDLKQRGVTLGSYTAVCYNNEVVVGCQKFTVNKIKALIEEVKSHGK